MFALPQSLVSRAPETEMLTAAPRLFLQYDNDTDVAARTQSFLEPQKKHQIESLGQSGDFSASSSKKPRPFKRPKNAIRDIPSFACPLYKRDPSKFGGPRGCASWCTLEIHRLFSDHLKKHANNGDISCETLDVVKKLKSDSKDLTPEAKAAERWSLTYCYLHKLSSEDKIPSPYYQRPEASFERSESLRHEPEQLDSIPDDSSLPLAHEVAAPSKRSPSRPQLPDFGAKYPSSTQAGKRSVEVVAVSLPPQDRAIDVRDKNGRTALMRVAEAGDHATARLLLELGAALNAKDEGRRTALLYAVKDGNASTTKLLLEWGAAVESHDESGWTALHYAAMKNDATMTKMLLESGAPVNARDVCGRTALYLAVSRGYEATVKQLLARDDIDPNSIDLDGRTFLFVWH